MKPILGDDLFNFEFGVCCSCIDQNSPSSLSKMRPSFVCLLELPFALDNLSRLKTVNGTQRPNSFVLVL